jgi:hypothetical protein
MLFIIIIDTTLSAGTRVYCKHVILHHYKKFKRQLPGEIVGGRISSRPVCSCYQMVLC